LLAAVAMQMCLGATYSWSVYVQPLKALTGMPQGPIHLPFSLFYFTFPATMILSGSLLPRLGPRICAASGGILFGGGWLLASLGGSHFGFVLMGIGVLGGVGVGLAYIVPIATCIQWFPSRKGLVTGIAVAGFGGGAALVSQVAGRLINTHGATPFETFGVFGIIFLLVVTFAGLTMQNPPSVGARHIEPLFLSKVIARPPFWILYLAMFTGLAAGFAVNANLKELYVGQNVQAGIAAVSLFAIANALGRITWGVIFDTVKSATAIQGNLICQALVLLSAFLILRSAMGLQVFAFFSGFNYGGVLVVYASSTARTWGAERVGQVYSWLFSANIPAALSPIWAGYCYDRLGSFTLPLSVIGVLLLLSSLLVQKTRDILTAGHLTPS
jgi:OFA family oxalate/formate antiporter-like MFS transporter